MALELVSDSAHWREGCQKLLLKVVKKAILAALLDGGCAEGRHMLYRQLHGVSLPLLFSPEV